MRIAVEPKKLPTMVYMPTKYFASLLVTLLSVPIPSEAPAMHKSGGGCAIDCF